MKIKASSTVFIFISCILAGCGPSNFEDCVLQNLKGINNEDVKTAVLMTCRKKFPSKFAACSPSSLDPQEFSKISGKASVLETGKPYFSVDIYNGLPNQAIKEIVVLISGENIQPPQEYKLYLEYPIPPKSSGEAGAAIQAYAGKNFQWSFTSVKTCPE